MSRAVIRLGWGDKLAASHFGLTSLAVANWVVDTTFTPKWNAVLKTRRRWLAPHGIDPVGRKVAVGGALSRDQQAYASEPYVSLCAAIPSTNSE